MKENLNQAHFWASAQEEGAVQSLCFWLLIMYSLYNLVLSLDWYSLMCDLGTVGLTPTSCLTSVA